MCASRSFDTIFSSNAIGDICWQKYKIFATVSRMTSSGYNEGENRKKKDFNGFRFGKIKNYYKAISVTLMQG